MEAFLAKLVSWLTSPIARWSAGIIAGIVVAAVVLLYGFSEWVIARTYDPPQITLHTEGRPASAVRGEHWSKIFGCQGCHGQAGRVMIDGGLLVGRVIAPDLASVVAAYSDDELVTLLRAGVKRDRTSLVVMPTESFAWMADEDVADIIAWLHTLKPVPDAVTGSTSFGPMVRFLLLNGAFNMSAEHGTIAKPPSRHPSGSGPEQGDYLYNVTCNHCHYLDKERLLGPGLIAPALAPMAAGYDLDQFKRLLRTGMPIGDRKLELMDEVATGALRHLDDEEIAALHSYLSAHAMETAEMSFQ